MSDYVELHASSAFSFLRGASPPEELAQMAAQRGLAAVAVCDRNGLYGSARFTRAATKCGVQPIVGCELTMEDGVVLPVLVETRRGYMNLCTLLSTTHLRVPKGEATIAWKELPEFAEGLIALAGGEEPSVPAPEEAKLWKPFRHDEATRLRMLREAFGEKNVFLEVQRHRLRGENRRVRQLAALAEEHRLPLLATNGVAYDCPQGRAVLDAFTCLRHHTHLDAAGLLLAPNAERHLKTPAEMCALFHDLPEATANTVRLAERLQFRLGDLGYEFPCYLTPDGSTQEAFLRRVADEGAHRRYGATIPVKVRRQMDHELRIIEKLGFAGYFLIVWDIVNFCREENIMVQGRGSAANSAVCFCLGITAVDAVKHELLFERFLSEGRKGWPDIDLDLPSGDRRERVIQEVYRRYGRFGAAMTANVITYRGRSAARELGKVLNFPENLLERFSALFASGDFPHTLDLQRQIEQAGFPSDHPRLPAFMALFQRLRGLPRHLGQHSGGMIICQDKLGAFVPLENASMPGRSVAQWDKEDCEELGIIKVDLLGLGMMSALQDSVELCAERGDPIDLAKIPMDDGPTFDLMCRADTIGVFQIESRAQMATLPRMKPRTFYDVAIEVAIIRPGPIQGGLMHPFLRRRAGEEPITYIDPRLEPVLRRTLGVPLFQEQILQIAMTMADFTGSEAEELRRAVSFHRSPERMSKVVVRMRAKMTAKGVGEETQTQIVSAIQSFALYGFPESHALSFALLAYASCWLKVHRPAEFFASLLNNQPMGFYGSDTLLKDARRHDVRTRPVCLGKSDWRCLLEDDGAAQPAIRLGFCIVRGLRESHARALLAARAERPFSSIDDLKARVPLDKDELRVLAEIGALNFIAPHRRAALWEAERELLPFGELFASCVNESPSPLAPMAPPERLAADYRGTGMSTGPHTMAMLRGQLPDIWRAGDLPKARNGTRVRIAGAVICRQRPGTAKGFVFISLEDETGVANAIVPPRFFEENRLLLVHEPFLVIEGPLQNNDGVIHIRAETVTPLTANPATAATSHDFH